MTEYLPNFIVEPVLRQARRLSRLSTGEESPNFLPAVPESLRTWYPTRFWSTSPPPSIDEHEEQEGTFQQLARSIQLWTTQLEPTLMDEPTSENDVQSQPVDRSATESPPVDPPMPQQPRPVRFQEIRTGSDTSLNPLRDLPDRARVHDDATHEHAQSDSVMRTNRSGSMERAIPAHILADVHDNGSDPSRSRDGSGALPEDDGMGPLRHRINAVWAGDGTPAEKSKLVHVLMQERYRATHGGSKAPLPQAGRNPGIDRRGSPMSIISGASQEVVFNLTSNDLIPTYAPLDEAELGVESEAASTDHPEPVLGCAHYQRNVKIQCNDCERWYTCRICHDEAEDHILSRRDTRHMLCMLCNTPQAVSQTCRMCGQEAAYYYCSVCKLWNNDSEKSVYHCDDCGICRLGKGLGKDFFHCKKCVACMSIQVEDTHRCIEDSTKCDCPICGEYMFTSSNSVVFMRCGHSIHETCFKDWCHTSYKCPICSRSIANMESQFRRLDRQIEEQPMPEEYRDTRAFVYCNDCASKTTTSYHWLGLKCEVCESYNTTQLQLVGRTDAPPVQSENENNMAAEMVAPTNNISDEAVPIPNSRGASRRQSGIAPQSPVASESSWLMPHSPTARSISPIVGSYFGTDRRESAVRRAEPLEDDEHLDFWGARSPPRDANDAESDDGSEEASTSDEVMEEDDVEDDEEDRMALFGHR